jgi:signal transduction histidine kinase/CheY-like chemotaxis protein
MYRSIRERISLTKHRRNVEAARPKVRRINFEKFEFLVKFLYPTLYAQIVVALLVAWYLNDSMPVYLLVVWCTVFVFLIFGGWLIGEFYKKEKAVGRIQEKFEYYTNWAAFFCFACGLFWAITALAQIYSPLYQQVILILILLGQAAGSVIALAPNMKLFYAGVPVSLLPVGLTFLWLGDQVHSVLGLLLLVFFVFASYFGHKVNDLITETITLKFENDDLLTELTAQKEKAEDASQAKSTFLASASHDLRQPLHALTLYVSVLEQDTSPSKIKILSDKIKYTLSSLQTLFDGLLDISKLDAGIHQPQKENFMLGDFIHRFKSEFNTLAANKGLALSWPDLNLCLYSDPLLLEQILRNLLGNSVRYTPKGSISIVCEQFQDKVRLDVVDTGLGIPQQHQSHIFREFYKVSNGNDTAERGMGLGLSIANRTAQLLQHKLDFESTEGRGSRFSIFVDAGNKSELHQEQQLKESLVIGEFKRQTNIVVIDDEVSILDATRDLLESWGCTVLTSTSIANATVDMETKGFEPDAIITDYRLSISGDSSETGVDAIISVRRYCNNEALPAVVLTGDAGVDKLHVFSSRSYLLLHKPVKPAALRAFILSIPTNSSVEQLV